MAVRPGTYDMEAQRHASYTCTFQVNGITGTPSMQIRYAEETTGASLLSLNSTQITMASGILTVSLSKADIEALPLALNPNEDAIFSYDIRLTSGSTVTRLVEGKFIVHAGVTRDA